MSARQLLLSIHDVSPVHADRLDQLMPVADRHAGFGGYALLLVPDFHQRGRLDSDPRFATRLRAMIDAGAEPFLHGYFHLDDSTHADPRAKARAALLTAGEGEFLGLSRDAARQKLRDGRALVEDVIGRQVAGFIAPAWLYSDEARDAVADEGFALAEDHWRVWRPSDGSVLTRGPVVTYATRTRARLASSLLWSRLAGPVLASQPIVRVGLHPHDVDAPAIMREINRLLKRLTARRSIGRYSGLLSTADHLPNTGAMVPDSLHSGGRH